VPKEDSSRMGRCSHWVALVEPGSKRDQAAGAAVLEESFRAYPVSRDGKRLVADWRGQCTGPEEKLGSSVRREVLLLSKGAPAQAKRISGSMYSRGTGFRFDHVGQYVIGTCCERNAARGANVPIVGAFLERPAGVLPKQASTEGRMRRMAPQTVERSQRLRPSVGTTPDVQPARDRHRW